MEEQKMEEQKIVKKFEQACIKYENALEKECSARKANRYSKIIRDIRKQLLLDNNVEILESLCDSTSDGVLLGVATSIIFVNPAKAISMLEKLEQKRGLMAFEAQMTLSEWKKGNIKRP